MRKGVFINCPFDNRYRGLFHAIAFAVTDCGFIPRCALEADDGGEERFRKVKRIIRESQYGVHDISRINADRKSGFPRFNMPRCRRCAVSWAWFPPSWSSSSSGR